MKKIISLLMFLLCFQISIYAQSKAEADKLMKDAEQSFEKSDFNRARQQYRQAFDVYRFNLNYAEAIASGTKTSDLYRKEYMYKEAFSICWEMDKMIMTAEKQDEKKYPAYSFYVSQERFYLYSKIRNKDKSAENIQKMTTFANQANDAKLLQALRKDKVKYAFIFDESEKSMDDFRALLSEYKSKKAWDEVSKLYTEMRILASSVDNDILANKIQTDLSAFRDSLSKAQASEAIQVVERKLSDSQQLLQEQEDDLQGKNYHVFGLYVVVLVLLGLVGAAAMLILFLIRKGKETETQISSIKQQGNQQAEHIQKILLQFGNGFGNIADAIDKSSLEPKAKATLMTQVNALCGFTNDAQILNELECNISEAYEQNEFYIDTFCKNEVLSEIQPLLNKGVEVKLDTPHMLVKTNAEALKSILIHLLRNAAKHTTEGKIMLIYKKRSAKSFQLHVMDTGSGIAEECMETLFIPYSVQKDLTKGSGLGLPTCFAMAKKMKGSLTVDANYKKGAFFILEVRS